MLVSNKDVDSYHQIDKDLFILKTLTEKSELWANYGKRNTTSTSSISKTSSTCSLNSNKINMSNLSKSFSNDDINQR